MIFQFKKITLSLLIILLIMGCSNTKNLSQPNSNKRSEKTDMITLYGQQLQIPKNIYNKIYPEFNMDTKSIFKNKSISHEKGKFIGKYRPYYILNFDKQLYISEIKIFNTGLLAVPILNVKNKKESLVKFNPIAFIFNDKQVPTTVHLGNKNSSELEQVDFLVSENKEYIVIKLSTPIFTNQLHIAISGIENPPFGTKCEILNDYTFELTANDYSYIDEVIINTLKTRSDLLLNEDLIRKIALEDKKLFRKIQSKSRNINVTNFSLINLPQDADINYALKNYSNIVESRVYKNINGQRKVWKISSQNNSKKSLFNTNELNIQTVNTTDNKIKKADNEIKYSEYIDFSQGI